jgi:sec-independent protein translocase protein TatB
MFNLGFTELLLLGVIALIFIGPNQLPEVARTVGRLLNEWRRATSDFQSTITSTISEDVQGRWNEARLQNAEQEGPDAQAAPDALAAGHDHGHGEHGHGHDHAHTHEHDYQAHHDQTIHDSTHMVTDHEVAEAVSTGSPTPVDHLPAGAAPVAGKGDKKS